MLRAMILTGAVLAALLTAPTVPVFAQATWRNPGRLDPGRLSPLPSPLTSGFPESASLEPVADADPQPGVVPRTCEPRPWDYMACRDSSRELVDGFHFSNTGVNRVITRPYDPLEMSPQRWFQLDYHSHARQEISLWISDMPSGRVSDFLESFFVVLPRKVLPSIKVEGGRFVLTLPTGEPVLFDEASKEIVGGVFTELGPQQPGVFARLAYTGSGVVIRADRRGADPRIGSTATIQSGSRTCKLPSSELWALVEERVDFRFPTDAEADAFLKNRCGFGLP